ncbi:MAG: DUF6550 family protein [Parcubacteria group bacterium]|jgi:hypothetical protein
MFYEPLKAKRYIIIGTSAVILAVLIVAIVPLFFKNQSSLKNPATDLSPEAKREQEKIQKEFDKLEAMRRNQDVKESTPEQIQQEFDSLEKQRAESSATQPTPEQIQTEFEKLEQMRK